MVLTYIVSTLPILILGRDNLENNYYFYLRDHMSHIFTENRLSQNL